MVLLAVLTNPILGMFDVRSPIGHKPDGGMLSVALLFRLIVIRRRVRRRPSLHIIVFNIIVVYAPTDII